MSKNVTANVYFAGCGLMEIGLVEAGIQVLQSFELNPGCVKVAQANHRHEVVQCDLTQKLVSKERRAAVRIFTYPCTKYAEIAALHGARTGDELYLHAFRHMAIDPPEIYVAENVPGMKMFPVVMEAMTRLPGYYVHVICPVSSQKWLPQRRDRLFIIGSRRRFDWHLPKATRPVRLRDILERRPDPDYPNYVRTRMGGGYRDLPIISDPSRNDIAPTCVAHYGKDLSTRLVKDRRFPHGVRPYTVREYARLQGVPDWFEFNCANSAAYRMIGNGVSVPAGRWIGREIKRYFWRYIEEPKV
jgi:DNA (cytosine-5)-methyltransferase 1